MKHEMQSVVPASVWIVFNVPLDSRFFPILKCLNGVVVARCIDQSDKQQHENHNPSQFTHFSLPFFESACIVSVRAGRSDVSNNLAPLLNEKRGLFAFAV
jgi:phosphate/sulfate permease